MRKLRSSAPVVLVAAALSAVIVRGVEPLAPMDDFGDATALGAAPADPTTGAVLLDLDDDVDSEELAALERALDDAVSPEPWPHGVAALGRLLSRPAQLHRLRVPASEVQDVLQAMRGQDGVEAVEVERRWAIPEASGPSAERSTELGTQAPASASDTARSGFQPDDPYYVHQWHLDQIQMPDAWQRERGAGAIVAVVDTGVLYRDHGRARQAPDLAQTRFVPGWDFVDGDDGPDDENGHGTHVAGTVAQSTNNGVGVAGVAPEAAIMPVRVLDADGAGTWGAVAAGIRFAADHGANVINLSLGGGSASRTIQAAIDHAHRKGVVVVAAAGNTGRARVEFPAAGRHVISVGAVRLDRELAFYSSFGPGLDLVAPGGDLNVDQNHDGLPDGVLQNTMVRGDPGRSDYLALQGTSMATPHVAGAAALLYAAGIERPDAIEALLERSAQSAGEPERFGSGLLAVDDALGLAAAGLGGVRGSLALGLGLLLLLPLARLRRLSVRPAHALFVAFAVAGGFGVLPWGTLGLGFLAAPLSAPGLALVGSWAPLLALLPIALVALGLSHPRLRTLAIGVGFGLGATLLVEVAMPTLPSSWPVALMLPLMLLAALLALAIARLAAVRA